MDDIKTIQEDNKNEQEPLIEQQNEQQQQQNTNKRKFKFEKIKYQGAKYYQLFFMQATNTIIMTAEKQGTTMALPYIQEDFNISQTLGQWVTTLCSIVNTCVTVPLSLLGQKFGINLMIKIFYLIQIAGCVGLFFTYNFYAFLVCRLIIGVSAVQSAAYTKMLTRLTSSKENQQKFMQYNKITSMSLSLVLPTLMSLIIDANWRYLYILAAGFCFLNFLYIFIFENVNKNKKPQPINYIGTVTLFITLLSLALLMQFLSDQNWVLTGVFGGLFVLFGIITLLINIKSKVKILPTTVLQHPTSDYIITQALSTMNMCILSYFFPQTYYEYGYDSVTYSIVLLCKNISALVVSFIMPKLSNVIINKTIVLTSIVCSFIGSLMFPASCMNIIALSVNYVLYEILTSPNMQLTVPMITLSVPYEHTILITGVPQTIYNIIQSITLPIVVSTFQLIKQSFSSSRNEQTSWENALQIEISIIPIVCVIQFILIYNFTGQLESENKKKKFNQNKVIMLQVEDNEDK